MNKLIWLLKWVLKAAIFFTLFAFALNNQQDTTVYFFFGKQWHGPQVLIVLIVFALGVAVGVLGMIPHWWRQKRTVKLPPRSVVASGHAAAEPTPIHPSEPPHGL
jgi:lipopolysaccharide assembly protein A